MRIPGADPLVVEVRAAEVKQQPGSARVSFAFGEMPDSERTRLEILVFDTALSQLTG